MDIISVIAVIISSVMDKRFLIYVAPIDTHTVTPLWIMLNMWKPSFTPPNVLDAMKSQGQRPPVYLVLLLDIYSDTRPWSMM